MSPPPVPLSRKRARARLSILHKFLREIDMLGRAMRRPLAKIDELASTPVNEASEKCGGACGPSVAASRVSCSATAEAAGDDGRQACPETERELARRHAIGE